MNQPKPHLPEGTVTFVFTDVESSTRLAAANPQAFREALNKHNGILRAALAQHEGTEVRTEGDSLFAVFRSAPEAVLFAADAQRALAAQEWPDGCALRVRMGIHTGTGVTADHHNDDYVGVHVHRAARIEAAAYGGQVLVSEAVRAVAAPDLADLVFRDMGLHRLKGLEEPERLYQIVIPGLRDEFPDLPTSAGTPHNLPADLTKFVGRETILREAAEQLEDARLLTLTGPGGTGKTRLSIRLGNEMLGEFPDGVFFVDLAATSDGGVVPAEILNAIGVRAAPGISAAKMLLHYLSGRTVLLILDNLEQIPGVGSVVSSILQEARDVKVLATSRAALRVRGEREFPVPPLALPADANGAAIPDAASSEAVALFLDRARDVKPDFTVDRENAAAISALVRRLDGLPLAIELAAARVRALTVPAILDRLGPGLLVGGPRDLPERQQAITAAIDWSYDLLSGACRRLFERFSVFAGGAGLEEIEAVCGPAAELGGEVIDALTELVDQSLLIPPGRSSGTQYHMLLTIRDYAQTRLAESGEQDVLRDRHLNAYAALAEKAAPHLITRDQIDWLDRLADDHDNLRSAFSWAVTQGRADPAMRLAGHLWRFWQIRGHLVEGRERVSRALAMPGGSPDARLLALEAAGGIAYWMGSPSCSVYYSDAVELAREVGEPAALANALYNASFAEALVDRDRAMEMLGEARDIYQELGDETGSARVSWGFGNVLSYQGDYAGALDYFRRSIAGFEGSDRPFDRGWALFALGFAMLQAGDAEGVEPALADSLRVFLDANDVSAVVMHLAAFAAAARGSGEEERAYRLAGATSALRDETGFGLVDSPENAYPGLTREDLARLEGRDADAFAEGRAMPITQAVAYALREVDIGGGAL